MKNLLLEEQEAFEKLFTYEDINGDCTCNKYEVLKEISLSHKRVLTKLGEEIEMEKVHGCEPNCYCNADNEGIGCGCCHEEIKNDTLSDIQAIISKELEEK